MLITITICREADHVANLRGPDLGLDFDVNASRQIEFHQRIDSLLSRLEDVQESLVGPNFELFARLFVYMRRSENAILIDYSGKRDRTTNRGACPLRRVYDLPNGLIENAVIESFEFDPNLMFDCHLHISKSYFQENP
jgi:hypothetical protein